MFSGLVDDLGSLKEILTGPDGARLEIETSLASQVETGDSVAVNGVCLTATSVGFAGFSADAVAQTLNLTSLGTLKVGDRLNLELALRAGDRLGGHIVQGHVDNVGCIVSTEPEGFSRRLRIGLDEGPMRYVIPQGSITIEGVSLTVAASGEDWLEVTLIPETLQRTNLGSLGPGKPVNIECDVIARYVERMVSPYGDKTPLSDQIGA